MWKSKGQWAWFIQKHRIKGNQIVQKNCQIFIVNTLSDVLTCVRSFCGVSLLMPPADPTQVRCVAMPSSDWEQVFRQTICFDTFSTLKRKPWLGAAVLRVFQKSRIGDFSSLFDKVPSLCRTCTFPNLSTTVASERSSSRQLSWSSRLAVQWCQRLSFPF